jgi:ABC-type multidrug transport system fused ATPase/permease subunit
MGIPKRMADCLQEFLSAKRIGAFLITDNVEHMDQPLQAVGIARVEGSLSIRGTVAWYDDGMTNQGGYMVEEDPLLSPYNPSFKLTDIDVTFPRGQMTLIAGKYGSGKTLMLLALLGEAHLVNGHITYALSRLMRPDQALSDCWDLIPDSTAYVPQTAWLQSQSIR